MQSIKKTFVIFTALLFLSGLSFAQSTATGNANVKISIKPGLQITNETGDIIFDDVIIVGDNGTATKTPDAGARFRVDGHKSGTVSVTFGNATLNNGTDNLTFIPNVDYTGASATYGGSATDVASGSTVAMDVSGSIYLWVGGDIAYDATKSVGDYTGTFNLTVAY